jgi:hypothetical protein
MEGRRADDRLICGYCGRKMVPRTISYQGRVERSVRAVLYSDVLRLRRPNTAMDMGLLVILVVLFVVRCIADMQR